METPCYVAVQVDEEFPAERWWAELRERYPNFADSLSRNGHAVIHTSLWPLLATLPGFADGPKHAPDALIDVGDEGEGWANVVGSRHQVFDSLS